MSGVSSPPVLPRQRLHPLAPEKAAGCVFPGPAWKPRPHCKCSLLAIEAHKGSSDPDRIEDEVFSERYLLERPLLAAIRRRQPPVLPIDEVDRADEEFEAFLLELLSGCQVSIPELGTIKAKAIPHVALTSNGTREFSDAPPLSLSRLPRSLAGTAPSLCSGRICATSGQLAWLLEVWRFIVSRNRRTALSICFRAIPDGKPLELL